MRSTLFGPSLLVLLALLGAIGRAAPPEHTVRRIYDEALVNSPAYAQLAELVERHPGRLAGSAAMQGAVRWAEQQLRAAGADDVRLQPVTVPAWERGGPESVELAATGEGTPQPLAAIGLGWTVATPPAGLRARVVEVKSLEELQALGETGVRGRIVFFNRPVPRTTINPGEAYGQASDQRNRGPAAAARLGAVGALVRSMTQSLDDVPHAGYTGFKNGDPRIPAAALSTLAADRLSSTLKRDPDAEVVLRLSARWLPDRPCHNVIGEIRGTEPGGKILLVGAHLDSWDNTPGAHDDGAGVVQAIEVIRLFRTLGIRPKHTIRCVLFTAEENSLAGGLEYARAAREAGEQHLLAIESDIGGFGAQGFEFDSPEPLAAERVAGWKAVFEPYGVHYFRAGHGGGDVTPLRAQGAVVGNLRPDSHRYFDLHHTSSDTLDKVNPRELQLGAAALASFLLLVDQEGF